MHDTYPKSIFYKTFHIFHLSEIFILYCIDVTSLAMHQCVMYVKRHFVYFTRYMDLNCPEVENILTILLIFSCTCNGLGALVAGWYSYLHWSTRYRRPKYTQVRTNTIAMNNKFNNRPIYKLNLEER